MLFTVGAPDFRKIDKRYLFLGLPTANLSSLSICLAIFTSSGGAQTMEVEMVNYLWPSLTILFAVLIDRIGTCWWLYPGLVVAFIGIIVILSGDQGFSFSEFAVRFAENPVSYLLALTVAVTWAGYLSMSMTRAWGGTTNLTTLIFIVDTSIFGLLWLVGVGSASTAHGIVSVLFGGIAVGMAYAAWTLGMSRGNMAVLAAASYFTPMLSCVFATFWIDAKLDFGFWSGVALVVAGSLLCWDATGRGMRALKTAGKRSN